MGVAPFQLLADTVLASAMAAGAVFTPTGGSSITTRALVRREDPVMSTFGAGSRSPGLKAWLTRSAVALRPKSDDHLDVTDGPFIGAYLIRDVSENTPRTAWELTLVPA